MRAFLLLPFLALAGCSLFESDDEDGFACTTEFVSFGVTVLTPDGEPAEGVRVTATNERTGTTYGPCEGIAGDGIGCEGESGSYSVYTDAQLGDTSEDGDDVTVRGQRGDLSFEADFRFAGGVCHIGKVSGPDTVTLR